MSDDSSVFLPVKELGYIRFIDRFGVGRRYVQRPGQSTYLRTSGARLDPVLGLRILLGYYFLGLEIRILGRWLPLGISIIVLVFLCCFAAIAALAFGTIDLFGRSINPSIPP